MRPTKEMILETQQLVSKTEQSIKNIIKANDQELESIRNKDTEKTTVNLKVIYGAAIVIVLLITFQAYRFFFSG